MFTRFFIIFFLSVLVFGNIGCSTFGSRRKLMQDCHAVDGAPRFDCATLGWFTKNLTLHSCPLASTVQ